MKNRIIWIDTIRGLCMMAILLYHTEVYYSESEISDYNLYASNALIIFFFVSGYLMYREHSFQLQHRLKSVLSRIIMPYFIFTLILAVGKCALQDKSVTQMLQNVILGRASWFIAALAVSEILFSLLLYLSEKYCKYILPFSCIAFFISSVFLNSVDVEIWNYNISLMAMLFLYAGYLYHRHEAQLLKLNHIGGTLLAAIALIMIKYMEYRYDVKIMICPLLINNYPIFLVDSFVSILLLVNISKWIPRVKLITYMGSHSITYYFLCGIMPLLTGVLLRKVSFPYSGYYYRVFIALAIVYVLTTVVTWIIYNYLSWMVDFHFEKRKTES